MDTKVFTRLLFLQYHDLNHMTQRLWSGDGNSQSFWVFQFLRGGFSESDAVPPLKIRLQRAFSVFMWVQIAKCRQGQAQHTWAQSSHPQRGLFAYLLFWKSQVICSCCAQKKLISKRKKSIFLTHVSSMEQLIKSDSLSLNLKRNKQNENLCTTSASYS